LKQQYAKARYIRKGKNRKKAKIKESIRRQADLPHKIRLNEE
jgi:hypothetical protein